MSKKGIKVYLTKNELLEIMALCGDKLGGDEVDFLESFVFGGLGMKMEEGIEVIKRDLDIDVIGDEPRE
jgi:hypothetical protein